MTTYDQEFDWDKYPGLKEEIQKLTRGSTTSLKTELETRQYRNKFVPVKVPSLAAFRALSPRDGDWIRLPNGQGGWWQFVYDASIADTYKWVFMGGPPMTEYVYTDETTTTVSTWLDLATVGPQLTNPYSGFYDAEWGVNAYNSSAATASAADIAINAATQTAGGANCEHAQANSAQAASAAFPFEDAAASPVAAGANVRILYLTTGGTQHWRQRWLIWTPRRIRAA